MGVRSRSRSLSVEMTVYLMVISGISILTVGLAVLVGVYRYAVAEQARHLRTYQQILTDGLDTRFTAAARVVSSLALAESVHAGDGVRSRALLAEAVRVNGDCFDALAIVGPEGRFVVESNTAERIAARSEIESACATPHSERTPAVWLQSSAGGPPVVWLVRTVRLSDGGTMSVFGRVRRSFLTQIVEDIAVEDGGRIALVIDERTQPVAWAGTTSRPDLSEVVFGPLGEDGFGVFQVDSARFGPIECGYVEYDRLPGMRWRLAVGQPRADVVKRTGEAFVPAAVVMLVMLGVAVQAVALFSRQVVAPMQLLEDQARRVSSGEYTRPVSVDREDEIGRLATAFNAMAGRLNALQDLAQLVAGASSLDQLLDAVVTAVDHILGTGDVGVFILDETTGDLRLARAVGCCAGGECSITLADASCVTAAYRTGRPSVLQLWSQTSPGREGDSLFSERGFATVLAVPLVAAGSTPGVAVAGSKEPREFTEAELETVRTFAAHAAVALQNSRLFEHEHRARREAEALREVTGLFASPMRREEALDSAASVAATLVGAAEGVVVLAVDQSELGREESDWLQAVRAEGAGREGRPTAEPLVVQDRDHPDRVVMLVPLRRDDAVSGMLVLRSEDPGGFTPRDVRLAATIGTQVSLALENAWLFDQATSRATNLERIFRISRVVSSSLDVQVVLNRVLDVVQAIFSAEAVSLMREDVAQGTISTVMARGVADTELLGLRLRSGEELPGAVFESRQAVRADDLATHEGVLATLATAQGLRSMVAVPLLARGRSIGVLSVFSLAPAAFSEGDMELLLTFASQAALAIDTATLYGREHHVASVLQSSILPGELPDIGGLDAASVCVPASPDADIGGDYLDLFSAPDGRVVLAIGDVCGKGVEAATKTSMIKYLLRGLVAAGLDPSAAMAELNDAVAKTGDIADVVTMWVGMLDVETGALHWADAGHPPALVLSPGGGGIARLGPTGPLLGAIENARYGSHETVVEHGATLVLYTDGVTEARGRGGMFGEGRVRRVLRKHVEPDELVHRLLAAVHRFSDGRLRDDAAILSVRLLDRDDQDMHRSS